MTWARAGTIVPTVTEATLEAAAAPSGCPRPPSQSSWPPTWPVQAQNTVPSAMVWPSTTRLPADPVIPSADSRVQGPMPPPTEDTPPDPTLQVPSALNASQASSTAWLNTSTGTPTTGMKSGPRNETASSNSAPAPTEDFSACMVSPAGRTSVWARARVMNAAAWARVTDPTGLNVPSPRPWATPISTMARMA